MLVLSVLFISCKKEKKTKDIADNIFNYKEYIVQTTNGEVSKNTEIRISFAKEIKDWSQDKIISEGVLEFSNKVKGKIETPNSTTLIFKPSEYFTSNKEFEVKLNLDLLFVNVPEALSTYTFKFKTIQQILILRRAICSRMIRNGNF